MSWLKGAFIVLLGSITRPCLWRDWIGYMIYPVIEVFKGTWWIVLCWLKKTTRFQTSFFLTCLAFVIQFWHLCAVLLGCQKATALWLWQSKQCVKAALTFLVKKLETFETMFYLLWKEFLFWIDERNDKSFSRYEQQWNIWFSVILKLSNDN